MGRKNKKEEVKHSLEQALNSQEYTPAINWEVLGSKYYDGPNAGRILKSYVKKHRIDISWNGRYYEVN